MGSREETLPPAAVAPNVVDPNLVNGVKESSRWVPLLEQPVLEPRKLRVVCIGAGFAGLTFQYKLKHESSISDIIDFVLYEKNGDVGGTWLENAYPGIACDVPAHIYTFPFEPNPDWSCFYAGGPEIWRYIKRTTKKYGLEENIQFNSRIIETTWDEESGKWKIKVDQGGSIIDDEADVLVNGTGFLNKWRWPEIEGLHDFKGRLVHTASWDPNINLEGKRVAVIGNGSSGIQVLPQIQPKASQLTTYIRTSTWIIPNFLAEFTKDGGNFDYSEEEKKNFREDTLALSEYRAKLEHSFNTYFMAFLKDSPVQAALHGIFKKQMEERLNNDPELCAQLIPDWHVGCRRITPGPGYLEALQEPNVRIEFNDIEKITPNGIKTQDGNEESYDVIVAATGFDISYKPFWKMVGKNGIDLAEQWKDDPEAYFGLCATNMPNYFMFTGPNAPVGHGSLMGVYDFAVDYMLRWCKKIATEDIKSATVKPDAVEDFNVWAQEFLKRTVWNSNCRSWYKQHKNDGKVVAMYPGSVLHYKDCLEAFRTEDFDFEYRSRNRFRWMGNGTTLRDQKGEDLAYYLKK